MATNILGDLNIFLSGDNVLISPIVSDLSGCPLESRWAGKTGMRGNQTITSNVLDFFLSLIIKIFFADMRGARGNTASSSGTETARSAFY